MSDTNSAPRTFEVAVFRAHASHGRAFWRGFGLIQDDIYALVEPAPRAGPPSDARLGGAARNTHG